MLALKLVGLTKRQDVFHFK